MSKRARSMKNLNPEEKVELAIEMSDVCVAVCTAGIKAQKPGLNESSLLEELRKRIKWMKRHRVTLRG
ncbi:MAG: hypothetical protein QXN75_01680 [Thermoproteota archaeon]|nr:hypothetical protein [Candidatus Brockarchaeota archaeon]